MRHVESQQPGPVLSVQPEAAGWPFAPARDVHRQDMPDGPDWGHSQQKILSFGRVSDRDFPVKCHPAASELATRAPRHVNAEAADVLGRIWTADPYSMKSSIAASARRGIDDVLARRAMTAGRLLGLWLAG